MPKKPFVYALAAAMLFGAATPASKFLLDFMGRFQLAGLLYFGAALGVLPFLFREKQFFSMLAFDMKTGKLLAGAVLFGGILGPILLLSGLKVATASSVSLWLNLELAATALLGAFFFRDRLTWSGWVSLSIMAAASVLLSVGEGRAGLLGGFLVAAACVCWGLDNHFTALIRGVTPTQTTFVKGLVAGGVNILIGVGLGGPSFSFSFVAIALAIGLISYGASLVLYISSAQNLGAVRSQIVFSSSPFFGVFFSVMFLRESLSVEQSVSAIMIIVSLVILFFERHGHHHSHEAVIHAHWHRHDDGHHDHQGDGLGGKNVFHSHEHEHKKRSHFHPHWPDQDHRHRH